MEKLEALRQILLVLDHLLRSIITVGFSEFGFGAIGSSYIAPAVLECGGSSPTLFSSGAQAPCDERMLKCLRFFETLSCGTAAPLLQPLSRPTIAFVEPIAKAWALHNMGKHSHPTKWIYLYRIPDKGGCSYSSPDASRQAYPS